MGLVSLHYQTSLLSCFRVSKESMPNPGLFQRPTMCLLFSLSSAFLLTSIVSVLALNPSQTLINLTPGPSSVDLSTTALASGNSTPILDWSTKNVSDDLEITCNSRFGTDLAYTSCSDAIASFQVPLQGISQLGLAMMSGSITSISHGDGSVVCIVFTVCSMIY